MATAHPSDLSNIREKIKKNDLVTIKHGRHHSGRTTSLAMVLDTKERTSYIIYIAGKGSEVKYEPFWIDNSSLILVEV